MKGVYFILILLFMFISSGSQAKGNDQKLSAKERSLVRISASAAVGDLDQLKQELAVGLDHQLTVNEIKESLIQLYAYAGFPRSLRGLQTFMQVLEERKSQGIEDVLGADATVLVTEEAKYYRGKVVLEKLTGINEDGPKKGYAVFAPTIEIFLKEHLFADIFERDILDYKQRELVTISILAALGNVQPMLKSHLIISLNVGYTKEQMADFIKTIQSISGEINANEAHKVLNEIILSNPS